METAQTQQQLAGGALERLERHTRGLGDVDRKEIRRTLVEDLRAVHDEAERAAEALHTAAAGRESTSGLVWCHLALIERGDRYSGGLDRVAQQAVMP